MSHEEKNISRQDFHTGKSFVKINRHIDTCLSLIERLIIYNHECRSSVSGKLRITSYPIDYRSDQFAYYENSLKSIYYSCYSLKYVYDISVLMNMQNVGSTIGLTLENQRRDITFTSVVKLSSIFEYTRKVYEKNISGSRYFEKLKTKYAAKVDSLELLNNFRNTIHSNGKWDIENKKGNLTYSLRAGEQVIKSGEIFKYDHWKLYRIIKDCLELSKLMALDNELLNNEQNLVSVKTDLSPEFLDKLFNSKS